jgi:Chloroplast import apparatus Tic20-like
MAWRGGTSPLERFYGCLPYALPMSAVLSMGAFLFLQIPGLAATYYLFFQLDALLSFNIIPPLFDIRFVVWICLFTLVVRNERIKHFLRFNTMQALMIDIIIVLVQLVVQLIGQGTGGLDIFRTLFLSVFTATFLAVNGVFIYAIVQNIRGLYPEIPLVSDIAYHHTRY